MAKRGGIQVYQAMLRAPTYGLWSGQMDVSNFMASFGDAVFTGLRAAWLEGAAQAGIQPDELTSVELSRMQTDIYVQFTYIAGFATFVISRSKANGGTLASVMPRMQMWVNRYAEFRNRGMLYAKLDQKVIWVRGNTKVSCGDCVRIAGKVKRASQFLEAGWEPRSYRLACKGISCQCDLLPTTEPMSKGRLPRLG